MQKCMNKLPHTKFASRVFLRKELDKEEKDLANKLIKKRGLEVVDDEEEATHILYPRTGADGEAYARMMFRKGEKCMVHFYR